MPAARLRSAGLLLALSLALASAPSCQWAGDTKAVHVSFAALRTQLDDVNTRLSSAIQSGDAEHVPALDKELKAVLEAAMNQASAMNILDREHLSISVATARNCITDMDRYAQTGDMDLLRAQAQQLAPTVTEILELLDRAERTTKAS
jgi:hypothetical protein